MVEVGCSDRFVVRNSCNVFFWLPHSEIRLDLWFFFVNKTTAGFLLKIIIENKPSSHLVLYSCRLMNLRLCIVEGNGIHCLQWSLKLSSIFSEQWWFEDRVYQLFCLLEGKTDKSLGNLFIYSLYMKVKLIQLYADCSKKNQMLNILLRFLARQIWANSRSWLQSKPEFLCMTKHVAFRLLKKHEILFLEWEWSSTETGCPGRVWHLCPYILFDWWDIALCKLL